MRSPWRLFPFIVAPMPFQLALDEILYRHAQRQGIFSESPLLRFYRSCEPWLSIGCSVPWNEDTFATGLHVCRRITGGGIVEHGEDLLVSLFAKKDQEDSFASVRVSYWKIHEAIKKGLDPLRAPRYRPP